MDNSVVTSIKGNLKVSEIVGFALLLLLLLSGPVILPSSMHYFRLIIGLALGYILTRSYTGFAGSVNRAYRNGSTKLMRAMLFMFLITAIANVAFLAGTSDLKIYKLEINPINIGLVVGALFFGFGMSLCSCCATGTLTDLATDFPRAGVTFIFFTLGVFLGFPLQNTQPWIRNSIITTSTGKLVGTDGVFLPDLFRWDHANGYLGAIILTALIVSFFSYLSFLYEKRKKDRKEYRIVESEKYQDLTEIDNISENKSEAIYDRLFRSPWSLKQGAIGMAVAFVLLMGVTKGGWGASTPYGVWFGKFINMFGIPASNLAAFTHLPETTFSMPWLENPVTVQDLGIFLGALIFVMTGGLWSRMKRSVTSLTIKNTAIFALGGFLMGFGTRMSNGCNVGALYTPISQLSLSGWIFFIFLVCGAIAGNMFLNKVSNK